MLETRTGKGIVDCDVHNCLPPGDGTLEKYLPARWASYIDRYGMRRAPETAYLARPRPWSARTDAWPEGGVPGSDLELLREQLLDAYDMDVAILNPINQIFFGGQPGQLGRALCAAVNDWTSEAWVEADARLRMSICLPWEAPDLAVEELRRMAAVPGTVQAIGNARQEMPLGNRKYWTIYECAEEHGLPVAFHVGGIGGHQVSSAGWPSFYFEDHSLFQQAFYAHLASLVFEGVFDRFPGLRIVLQEGGFSWVPSLGWRMDAAWRSLGNESGIQQPPSTYLAERLWFTTQPIEEPEQPGYFTEALDQMEGLRDRLLFSSDYPHWDFDSPEAALPRVLPVEERRRILGDNARAFYGERLAA